MMISRTLCPVRPSTARWNEDQGAQGNTCAVRWMRRLSGKDLYNRDCPLTLLGS